MSSELYLFRHGRTIWNAEGRYQGHADVELDTLGSAQALAIAQRCRTVKPIAVYTSDLRRCSDVANQIFEVVGVIPTPDKRLRERDFGEWSGLTKQEIAERFPDDFTRWKHGDESVRPGGGESQESVVARVSSFIEDVRAGSTGSVVAISHAGWIRAAVQWTLGGTFSHRNLGAPSPGSLTVFSLYDGAMTLESFNDRGHLMDVESVDEETPAPRVY